MAHANSREKPNVIWRFFSSVKLTILILVILAAVSIFGTVIPQRESAMEFARGLSPSAFKVYSMLGLFDVYHASWFLVLLGCLALNLVVCSIDRFPGAWKRFNARPKVDRDGLFNNLPPERFITASPAISAASDRVGGLLRSRFKSLREKDAGNTVYFYGDKGRYAHFGVYLVHLSVLLILVGGIVGSLFGFEAFVNIVEGERTDTVQLRTGSRELKLDFDVRCNTFSVEFYENGSPKEYRSNLSFMVNGKEAAKADALVNHPVRFNGITFYQSSYGRVSTGRAHLKITRGEGAARAPVYMDMEAGKSMPLPGKEGHVTLLDARGDFMRMGPAVLLGIRPEEGDETRIWVFQGWQRIAKQFPGFLHQFPKLNPSAFAPYTFYLEDLETKYYTGLQVNKDPGVNIVWLGCFLMVTGFILTFFTSHRRTWVRLSAHGKGTRIGVAGMSSKNPVGLERELERLVRDITHLFSESEREKKIK